MLENQKGLAVTEIQIDNQKTNETNWLGSLGIAQPNNAQAVRVQVRGTQEVLEVIERGWLEE